MDQKNMNPGARLVSVKNCALLNSNHHQGEALCAPLTLMQCFCPTATAGPFIISVLCTCGKLMVLDWMN